MEPMTSAPPTRSISPGAGLSPSRYPSTPVSTMAPAVAKPLRMLSAYFITTCRAEGRRPHRSARARGRRGGREGGRGAGTRRVYVDGGKRGGEGGGGGQTATRRPPSPLTTMISQVLASKPCSGARHVSAEAWRQAGGGGGSGAGRIQERRAADLPRGEEEVHRHGPHAEVRVARPQRRSGGGRGRAARAARLLELGAGALAARARHALLQQALEVDRRCAAARAQRACAHGRPDVCSPRPGFEGASRAAHRKRRRRPP